MSNPSSGRRSSRRPIDPNPQDTDLLGSVRLHVAIFAVAYAHDDDARVVRALNELGALLDITGVDTAAIECVMRQLGILPGATATGMTH
jgi:hypothetical protein